MFTGIVEEIGVIKNITKGVNSEKLLIQCNKVLEETKLGDSICTNGVCLTVTDINDHSFQADVMAETLLRSNLGNLTLGSEVNLERALTLSSRLGGHIVSGHIDGVGKIVSLKRIDNSIEVTIEAKLSILKYIIEKGSITIDGDDITRLKGRKLETFRRDKLGFVFPAFPPDRQLRFYSASLPCEGHSPYF